ncbi:MAG: molybdopterin dinucleotide binding domain-containing protein [Candidatus Bathyarchaeia archaeon]
MEVPPLEEEVYGKYDVACLGLIVSRASQRLLVRSKYTPRFLRNMALTRLPIFKRPMDPTPEYPLILISGCRAPFYVHSKYREIESFRRLMPHPVININPADAEKRRIGEGDDVIIVSPWGKIRVKHIYRLQFSPELLMCYTDGLKQMLMS